MKSLILILVAASTASAQTVQPWVDLSGSWKTMPGDNSAWAQPDFNDSAWRSRDVPLSVSDGSAQTFWLRKTVDLPPTLTGQPLALTLGKLRESYQLYVNGAHIASVGDGTVASAQLARPRTFELPALSTARIIIAVRVAVPRLQGQSGASSVWFRGLDTGPYVLTGIGNAPRGAGLAYIDRLRLIQSLDLLVGAVLLSLASIAMLIFLYKRTRTELLWLALHAAVVGYRRLQVALLVTADATPWKSTVQVGPLHGALLLEFVFAALSVPAGSLRILLWLPVPLSWLSDIFGYSSGYVIAAAPLLFLPWALAMRRERTAEHYFIVAAAAVSATLNLMGGSPLAVSRVGPYNVGRNPVFTVIFVLAMVLISVRRLVRDSAEKERLASDLEAARTMQNLLIPDLPPRLGDFAIEAAYQPAQEVGGDFYWTRQTPEGGLLCVIGDVSGKGLKAAMLVSVAVGILRNEKSVSPAAILTALNDGLAGHTGGGFVTCCCARFDVSGGVTLANAGHLSPYCNGLEVELETGLPLGISAGVEYGESLVPGDRFTFVSDGVVEASNAKAELFGFDRTRGISGKSAHEIAETAKTWGQNDDITVVTIQRLAPSPAPRHS